MEYLPRDADAWAPTLELCFISQVNGPTSSILLHQLWQHRSGKTEWRQIDLVPASEIDVPIFGNKPGEA